MKLKTSLQLSAIFPILLATGAVTLAVRESAEVSSPASLYTLAILGLLGITMSAIILAYSRRLFRKIDRLNQWIDGVLNGDLDQRVETGNSEDEIDRLAGSLGKMLKELKEAYASVQQEARQQKALADRHQQGAAASQTAVKQMAGVLDRLKLAQQETLRQERLQVLEQAIRRLTHDISEAMMPIVGTCDLLGRHAEILSRPDEARVHVRAMQDGADRLKKLLKNLTVYVSAEESVGGPTDLNNVVDEALRVTHPYFERRAEAKRRIEIKTQLGVIPAAPVDEGDARDALVNLLLNSVEAMPDGGVITITTRSEGVGVSLEVRDTGAGMTAEVGDRCRDPFFTTKKGAGFGMGLTFVDGLMRRSRGTLTIDTLPRQGTRVRLQFPAWTARAVAVEGGVEAPAGEGISVLVVDDDECTRETIARLLMLERYEVETASGGKAGLDRIQGRAFDVAIIDRDMPGMTGDELAAALQAAAPGTAVMMLTGFGDLMMEEGDRPAHVDHLVSKPVTGRELCAGIRETLAAHRARGAG